MVGPRAHLSADIDIQATQLVANAQDKLVVLEHLAQHLPRYAGAPARWGPIDPELLEEPAANQPRARGGMNLV